MNDGLLYILSCRHMLFCPRLLLVVYQHLLTLTHSVHKKALLYRVGGWWLTVVNCQVICYPPFIYLREPLKVTRLSGKYS